MKKTVEKVANVILNGFWYVGAFIWLGWVLYDILKGNILATDNLDIYMLIWMTSIAIYFVMIFVYNIINFIRWLHKNKS